MVEDIFAEKNVEDIYQYTFQEMYRSGWYVYETVNNDYILHFMVVLYTDQAIIPERKCQGHFSTFLPRPLFVIKWWEFINKNKIMGKIQLNWLKK